MANFFEGVGNLLMHPVNEAKWMWDSTKDVLSGDMDLKDIPGSHQEMMNDITVPLGGRNKLTENSDAVAGTIIGGIMAAPALMGGASASGGAPVVEAVGQSPLEAVLAGGGDASEVGSIAADTGLAKRMGGVINQMGKQLSSSSAAQPRQAPAFKPQFQLQQPTGFADAAVQQLGAADYQLKI